MNAILRTVLSVAALAFAGFAVYALIDRSHGERTGGRAARLAHA